MRGKQKQRSPVPGCARRGHCDEHLGGLRVAREASRTKRATVDSKVRVSHRIEALAALAKPSQGARPSPRRVRIALRLSAYDWRP
jgi:hypothetical protein